MDEQKIIDIATRVYNTQGTQYGVASIPGHVHNGVDANRISMSDIITTQKATILGTTGAITLNPSSGNLFTITPTGATQITPTSFPVGSIMVVRVLTSGASSYIITFDVGFVANGTLSTGTSTGRYFTVTFICDGTYWIELSRTPAMLPS